MSQSDTAETGDDIDVDVDAIPWETAVDRVPALCDRLDVSDAVRLKATELARTAVADVNRGSPQGLAAGAVYLAGLLVNEKETQPAVADAADLNVHTVRRNYRAIAEAEGFRFESRDSGDEESERDRPIGARSPLMAVREWASQAFGGDDR